MKVKISLFATLRKFSPSGKNVFSLDLEPPTTVAALIDRLGIPPSTHRIVLINGHHGKPEAFLADGDAVTMFPPMAGG